MPILMYIMLSGIKMGSLTDFGAPRILMTMETWGIILPAKHIAKQLLSLFSFRQREHQPVRRLPSQVIYEKTKKGACGVGDLTMKQRFVFLIPTEIRRHRYSGVFSRSSNLF